VLHCEPPHQTSHTALEAVPGVSHDSSKGRPL
jgi:hypothetical protein